MLYTVVNNTAQITSIRQDTAQIGNLIHEIELLKEQVSKMKPDEPGLKLSFAVVFGRNHLVRRICHRLRLHRTYRRNPCVCSILCRSRPEGIGGKQSQELRKTRYVFPSLIWNKSFVLRQPERSYKRTYLSKMSTVIYQRKNVKMDSKSSRT
jgi:hypothetical protein